MTLEDRPPSDFSTGGKHGAAPKPPPPNVELDPEFEAGPLPDFTFPSFDAFRKLEQLDLLPDGGDFSFNNVPSDLRDELGNQGFSFYEGGIFEPIPVPLDPTADHLAFALRELEQVNILATKDVLEVMNRFTYVPEIAWVLRTEGELEKMQATVYGDALDALHASIEEYPENSQMRMIEELENSAIFFKQYGNLFNSEEKTILIHMWSMIPWGAKWQTQKINEAMDLGMTTDRQKEEYTYGTFANVGGFLGSGIIEQTAFGLGQIFGSPGEISSQIQDPREKVIARAIAYMEGRDLNTLEEKQKFIYWNFMQMQQQTDEVNSRKGFMGKLSVLEAGFNVSANALAEQIARADTSGLFGAAASPDEYAWRKDLSVGEQVAIMLNMNPGDDAGTTFLNNPWVRSATDGVFADPWVGGFIKDIQDHTNAWQITSGATDFALNLTPVDPINLLAGVGAGFAVANKIPVGVRGVTKARLAWQSLRPFAGKAMDLPVLSRGTVARLSWVAFGKNVDQLAASKQMSRAVKWLSENPNTQRIIEKFPQLKGTGRLLNALASETDPEIIREYIRLSMHGTEIFGSSPMIQEAATQLLKSSTGRFTAKSKTALQDRKIGLQDVVENAPFYKVNINVDGLWDIADNVTDIVPGQVFRRSAQLDGGGGSKFVISNIDRLFKWMDIKPNNVVVSKAIEWLANRGDDAASLAGKLADDVHLGGQFLSNLTPEELGWLNKYMNNVGADGARFGDEMILGDRTADFIVRGSDIAPTGGFFSELGGQAVNMVSAETASAGLKAGQDMHLWQIEDMPRLSIARNAFTKFSERLGFGKVGINQVSGFQRGLKRFNASLWNRMPHNISQTNVVEGGDDLKRWIVLLGGSSGLARKWVALYRKSPAAHRNRILSLAFRELGAEIQHPGLREGLIHFTQKSGAYTYTKGKDGREIGRALTALGGEHVVPVAHAHLTPDFAMPKIEEMLTSIRRLRSTDRGWARFGDMQTGFLRGTQQKRTDLIARYKAQLRKQHGLGPNDLLPLEQQDLMKIAYADSFNQGTRANGMGYMERVSSIVAAPLRFAHSTFTVAQLVGRPIAWASRVLLEETSRASMSGLPSLWKNPSEFMGSWYDAHVTRRIPSMFRKQADRIDLIIGDVFKSTNLQTTLDRASEIIPDFRKLAINADVIDDPVRSRALFAHILGRELIGGDAVVDLQLGSKFNSTRRALLNTNRRINNHTARMAERGLPVTFSFDIDGIDILNKSLFASFQKEANISTLPLEWSSDLTPEGVNIFGRAYGRQLYQYIDDPIIGKWGLAQANSEASGLTSAFYTAETLATHPAFRDLKPNLVEVARARGLTLGNDLELAAWYLDDVVREIIDNTFAPLWRSGEGLVNIGRKEEITRGLLTGKRAKLEMPDGTLIDLRHNEGYESFLDESSRFTQGAFNQGIEMPQKIAAHFDARFGSGNKAQKSQIRRFADSTLQIFGESATQKLNRQPAYLQIQKKYNTYAKDVLGWSDDVAGVYAANRATEIVNHIFFNNASKTAFLHKMNQVVPFFSAWWEVLSTWAWKIPSQNFLPLGYAHLGRRIDRVMQSFVNTGIVGKNPENGQWHMNLAENLPTASGVGTAVSGLGHSILNTPRTIMEWLGTVANAVGAPGDGDFSDWGKDEFAIAFGNPLEILKTWPGNEPATHGVMAVNQWAFGPSPIYSLALGAILDRGRFAGDNERRDSVEGETWGSWMAREFPEDDVDLGRLAHENWNKLVDHYGVNGMALVRSGTVELEDLIMPADISIVIPNTSAWDSFVSTHVFPFGRVDNIKGVFTEMIPGTLQQAMMGLGVMTDDFDATGNWATAIFGPTSKVQTSAEVGLQVAMLEVDEGLLTKRLAAITEYIALAEAGGIQILGLESGNFSYANPAAALEVEGLQAAAERVLHLDAEIENRASSNAGYAMMLRGLTGFLAPATPRMMFEEAQQSTLLWSTRDAVEDSKVTGSLNYALELNEVRPKSAAELFNVFNMVSDYFEDSTGDSAKATFAGYYGQAWLALTKGKTFWGPSSIPPEVTTLDQFFSDVEDESRLGIPFIPLQQRVARAGIATGREIAIREAFGIEGAHAAANILSNWSSYGDVIAPFQDEFDALDAWDHFVGGGEYAKWQEENREGDEFSAIGAQRRMWEDSIDAFDTVINAIPRLGLDVDEATTITGQLKSARRGMIEIIREYETWNNDDTRNPREVFLNGYFLDVADPYYDGVDLIWDEINRAGTREEKSAGYDKLRMHANLEWLSAPTITDQSGNIIPVPNELLRHWNGLTTEEQQARMLQWVGGRAEWVTLQNAHILIAQNPEMEKYLPSTPEQIEIYDKLATYRQQVIRYARENPTLMTQGQRDKILREATDSMEAFLIANGRTAEVKWKLSWPIQRLELAGLLPQSLENMMPKIHATHDYLRSQDKSSTTEVGRQVFFNLNSWLHSTYFFENPLAAQDIASLGQTMYEESQYDAAFAKLFMGDFFGTFD